MVACTSVNHHHHKLQFSGVRARHAAGLHTHSLPDGGGAEPFMSRGGNATPNRVEQFWLHLAAVEDAAVAADSRSANGAGHRDGTDKQCGGRQCLQSSSTIPHTHEGSSLTMGEGGPSQMSVQTPFLSMPSVFGQLDSMASSEG